MFPGVWCMFTDDWKYAMAKGCLIRLDEVGDLWKTCPSPTSLIAVRNCEIKEIIAFAVFVHPSRPQWICSYNKHCSHVWNKKLQTTRKFHGVSFLENWGKCRWLLLTFQLTAIVLTSWCRYVLPRKLAGRNILAHNIDMFRLNSSMHNHACH